MIVQCEHCQTKYRIADEKVKGKGVRVRCAKCENVFNVTPPEHDEVRPAPAPPVSEPPAPEPHEPPGETRSGDREPGTPSPETPSYPQEEDHTDSPLGGFEPSAPQPGDPQDPGFRRPAHELDRADTAVPPVPDDQAVGEMGEFEIETTMREEDPLGPGLTETVPGGAAPVPPASGGDAGWGNIPIDAPAEGEAGGEGFGLAGTPDYQPPPPPLVDESLPGSDLPPPVESDASTSSLPAYTPAPRSSGAGRKWLVLLLFLAVLAGGGYFAYPKVMDLVRERGDTAEGTITPANIQVKALTRRDGKVIYSVRGEVRNDSRGSVGMVQVEAQFRNAAGEVISRAASYCGNVIDENRLINANMGDILGDLQNELGQSLSNANVQPGQSVPFLVVLQNPPAGVSKVTVTISGFKETT